MIGSLTQNIYLKMVRGDTLSLGFEIEGLTDDLDEVYFSCRTEYGALSYVFQGSLTNGEVTKEDTGKYLVKIPPAYTEHVAPGGYVYDLEVQLDGDVFTPLIGNLEIIWGVTES